MLLVIPALIYGSVAAGVGTGAGVSAAKANKRGVKAAKELQARSHTFQQKMSNTQVQRRSKDLEIAGFNKILAATGGITGSSPPGGTSPFPNLRNVGAEAGAGLTAGMGLSQQAANIGEALQRTKTGKEQADLYKAQTTGVMAQNAKRTLIGDSITSARNAAEWVWNKWIPKDMLDQTILKGLDTPPTTQSKPKKPEWHLGPKKEAYKFDKRGQHGSGSSGGTER